MDQLSALPDGLLHEILSFLPAPQVVQTCMLSQRWRNLWRSMPRLNIDEVDFKISFGISRGDLSERWGRFENFATNLLLFHDYTSCLGEFRFSSHLYNHCHVDRWIRRGIEYCPAMLRIQIYSFSDHGRFKLSPMAGSSFRHLRNVCIHNVDLDRNFTDLLCSACPVLEDMELDRCNFCGNYPQGITSPTMKKLVLKCCHNNTSHTLVITAPSLVYLTVVYGCYQAGLSIYQMDSLVKASIYISGDRTLPRKTQQELIGSLFNVTSLELIGFETEAIMFTEKSELFPVFGNMRTLHLEDCFLDEADLNDKLEALECFLHNAPCMEKLILDCCMFISFPDFEWEIERKKITLQGQDGKTFECPMLKLIEVIYNYDHNHQVIELLWSLGRRLPDASINLTKKEGL